jgi:murein DD-endopeptidase MepM/ murein hydrolase activator NlpD
MWKVYSPMTDRCWRLSRGARQTLRRTVVTVGLIAGTAAIAAPVLEAGGLKAARAEVLQAVRGLPAGTPAPRAQVERLVWQGVDVDGDGKADFANPTGHPERGDDVYGEGRFGASRDGGARRHEGADFVADAGQTVTAPISGYVTRIGYAYPGDQTLRFVEIANPALHYAARVFYVDPSVAEGDAVAIGRPIGHSHSLQQKYPGGMTDHVHLEIIGAHELRIDPDRMITARWENAAAAKG